MATIITSFDVWAHNLPRIEIYGSEGSLSVPDPNTFGGVVRVKLAKDEAWREVPLTHGTARTAAAWAWPTWRWRSVEGRPHRASGELALHVLDVMESVQEASESGQYVQVRTTCPRPAAMPDTVAG